MQADRVIQLSALDVGEREEAYVLEAMRSGILGQGPFARRFEEAFAAFIGTRYAVAVSSGTAGLHLLVRQAGVGQGDEVITSPISFIASANAALYERATPVFVDVDPDTFNIDPNRVEAAITPRTKAIMPVHIFGYPAAIEDINEIAARHSLPIIEDACEAVGAIRGGRTVGSFGNPAVFGFYPNKQMTTGEGGMVTTDSEEIMRGLRSMSNQGRADTGQWLAHDRLGFNYRMDDLSGALGLAQTERLDEILGLRQAVAFRYDALLASVDGVTPPLADRDGDVRSWFVYIVQLDPEIDRDGVIAYMTEKGVQTKPYLPAIHLQPYYQSLGHRPGEHPIAEAIAKRTLALPFHNHLPAADQERVVEVLAEAVAR